jgi:hypothetical protein
MLARSISGQTVESTNQGPDLIDCAQAILQVGAPQAGAFGRVFRRSIVLSNLFRVIHDVLECFEVSEASALLLKVHPDIDFFNLAQVYRRVANVRALLPAIQLRKRVIDLLQSS